MHVIQKGSATFANISWCDSSDSSAIVHSSIHSFEDILVCIGIESNMFGIATESIYRYTLCCKEDSLTPSWHGCWVVLPHRQWKLCLDVFLEFSRFSSLPQDVCTNIFMLVKLQNPVSISVFAHPPPFSVFFFSTL